MTKPEVGDPMDVCYCGDYRHQHDARGCIYCRNLPTAWSGVCREFKFFRASEPHRGDPAGNHDNAGS